MYTIYINNTLPPALAVHEIYRDIFGPPMVQMRKLQLKPALLHPKEVFVIPPKKLHNWQK